MVKVQPQQTQSEQQEESNVADEEMNEALLLRCWNGVEDQVNEAAKINKNSGVRYPEMYISFYDEMGPMEVLKQKRWLQSTINPKTGEFHTLEQLRAAGVVSESELKFFDDPLPRRELISMTRHQTQDRKEYLCRVERMLGLSASAAVVSVSSYHLDWTKKIHFEPDFVPINPENPKGDTARIVRVGRCMPARNTAQKIYLTPFTPSNVAALSI